MLKKSSWMPTAYAWLRRAPIGLIAGICVFLCSDRGIPIGKAIKFGEQRSDVLHSSSRRFINVPAGPQCPWVFAGHAGQRVTITCDSYEFNSYLSLLDPQGRQITWNEDSGWFFNSRIRATLPVSGQYSLIVSGEDADQYGTYQIKLLKGDFDVDASPSASMSYYLKGLDWARHEKNQRAVSWLNLAMGKYCRHRGLWQESDGYLAKSREAARRIGFKYGEWAAAMERGRLLTRCLRYDEAIAEFQQARPLGKQLRSADIADTVVSIDMGNLHKSMGRGDLAEVYYKRASAGVERSGLPSIVVRFDASRSKIGSSREKASVMKYAEKVSELQCGLDPMFNLTAVKMLSEAFSLAGKPERARSLISDAIAKARYLECLDEEVELLLLDSTINYGLGDLGGMVLSAQKAAEITSWNDPDPEPRRIALQMEALGARLQGDWGKGIQLCSDALQITEEAWRKQPVGKVRQRLLAESKAICTQIIQMLYSRDSGKSNSIYARMAFDYAERSRSREFLDEIASAKLQPQRTSSGPLPLQDRKLLAQISAVGQEMIHIRAGRSAEPAWLDKIEQQRAELVEERMQFEAKSARTYENQINIAPMQPITAEQVQKDLSAQHPNSAILFYQLGIQNSYLIVLTPTDARIFQLPNWTVISKAITEWRSQILRQIGIERIPEQAVQDYGRIAHSLFQMLLAPATPIIQDRNLIIAADRSLLGLAFESLVVSPPIKTQNFGQLHYVVEDHSITYAPSMSVLAEVEKRQAHAMRRASKQVLLVGDAVFNDDDPRAAVQPGHLAITQTTTSTGVRLCAGLHRLPATRDEVLSIARIAENCGWKSKVLLDFNASKENLIHETLASYKVLHLATHAITDSVEGDFSSIVLSIDAKSPGKDGLLTAAEASQLRLNADMVVLSGCSTGNGQPTGAEGIIGLSRAFLIAGANHVCASVWNVEDRSTQELMTCLYSNLLKKGQTESSALQQAKIDALHHGTAPCYWAPFVLIGPPSSIHQP